MNANQRIDISNFNRSGSLEKCRLGFNRELIYGLEYVADDYFKECRNQDASENSVDWFGLSDLTIE